MALPAEFKVPEPTVAEPTESMSDQEDILEAEDDEDCDSSSGDSEDDSDMGAWDIISANFHMLHTAV